MSNTTSRYAWLVGFPLEGICRVYVTPNALAYSCLCSVLVNGQLLHYSGKTEKEAVEAARAAIEGNYGPIFKEVRLAAASHVRVGRWCGVPVLFYEDLAISLQEVWVQQVVGCSPAAAKRYFSQGVRLMLHKKQQALLDDWCEKHDWAYVPIDASLVSANQDADYLL